MVYQTCRLLLASVPSPALTGFVFFSTMCSYNFHWYLTPVSITPSRRVSWTQHNKGLHLILYVIGVIGALVCFVFLARHWMAICFGAFVTFLYTAPKIPQKIFAGLRKIAIGKTLFLALVWTYVTTLLPIFVADAGWNGGFLLFTLSRFFLIYAICILFDFKDREDDKKEGIRSLITYLDEKGIDMVFMLTMALFLISTAMLSVYRYPALYIFFLLVPGIILAAIYRTAKRDCSDLMYYFVLDGLMMFSGLLMLIIRI